MKANIRERLRRETREDHERTDAAFAALDLHDRGDAIRFLTAHAQAVAAVEAARDAHSWPAGMPAPVSALPYLAEDFAVFGLALPKPEEPVELPEPVGATYVLAGSRFGGRVLLSEWRQGSDQTVLGATSYLAAEPLNAYARSFFKHLPQYSGDGEQLVESARRAFARFEAALS